MSVCSASESMVMRTNAVSLAWDVDRLQVERETAGLGGVLVLQWNLALSTAGGSQMGMNNAAVLDQLQRHKGSHYSSIVQKELRP